MKKLLSALSILFLLTVFSGCQEAENLKNDAVQSAENLKDGVMDAKESVDNTVQGAKDAVDNVKNAAGQVQEAADSVSEMFE